MGFGAVHDWPTALEEQRAASASSVKEPGFPESELEQMQKDESQISRQARWQRKHRAMGLCVLCSRPAFKGWRCKKHYEQHKITMRLRYIPKVRGRYKVSGTSTEAATKRKTAKPAAKAAKPAKKSATRTAARPTARKTTKAKTTARKSTARKTTTRRAAPKKAAKG